MASVLDNENVTLDTEVVEALPVNNAEGKRLRSEYRKLVAELASIKDSLGELSPQQIKELLTKEELRKTKELEETQAYKEALEQRTKTYNEKVSEKEKRIDELEKKIAEEAITNELYKAYVILGGKVSDKDEESLFDVFTNTVKPTVKVFSDGVFPVDKSGEPLLNEKGEVFSLVEYVDTLKNKKFKVFFEPENKTGMPPITGSSSYARRAAKTDPYENLVGLDTLKKYHELYPSKRRGT